MYVIATAGHVDHGKSTLIRALTGMESDRWAEERRRGMTIDLGYAWTTLPGGTRVAFVDVPGHQRFVTNMLAGVGPVPAVLFVVAADQGWSAQSTEHLDALEALGVRHGVLAVSRCDLGDAELAEAEAREYLAGSGLADMESVAVSPMVGTGMDELRAALERMTGTLPPSTERPTRLWIDRVFTIRGAGTVVTGTLSSGRLMVGDTVQVQPSGALVRIRGLQTLKARVDQASAVARVAVNLRGVKPTEVRRGDALTAPGRWADVSIVDVRISPPPQRLPSALVLHIGSAAVPVRVRTLAEDLARLTLAEPLPVHIGERLVLRDAGQQRIAAGAVVLDTMPPPLRRRGAARLRAAELADATGVPDAGAEVRRRGAVRRADLVASGVPVDPAPTPGVVAAGAWLIDTARWQRWGRELIAAIDDWAATHPTHPGMPRQAATATLGLPDEALLDLLSRTERDLVIDGDGIHRVGAVSTLPAAAEQQLALLVQHLIREPFDAPEAPELAASGLTDKVLAMAARAGLLVRIGPGLYLHPNSIEEAIRRLRKLTLPFTVSDARQALGTTRRVAVPLLEYLDRAGFTHRDDSRHRSLR